MKFESLAIAGATLVHPTPFEDERGYFARLFCRDVMGENGLASDVAQINLSGTIERGTVRGLHYQVAPALECKLVRCIQGEVHDQIVDMRPDSPSYRQHVAIRLSAENRLALFVPALCAHGFQALSDNAELLYIVDALHAPEHERGLRHDDPALGLNWPLPITRLSAKDRAWPLLGD